MASGTPLQQNQPEASEPARFRRAHRWAFLSSLSFHLAVLTALFMASLLAWRFGGSPPQQAATPAPPQAETQGGFELPPVSQTDGGLLQQPQEYWQEVAKNAAEGRKEYTPQEAHKNMSELAQHAPRVSAPSVDEIAVFLNVPGSTAGTIPPTPDGRLDYATATLQDITSATSANGEAGYRITLVDAAGRKSTFEVWGDEARPYDSGATVFDSLRRTPALGNIYRKILMPALPLLRKQEQGAAGRSVLSADERR